MSRRRLERCELSQKNPHTEAGDFEFGLTVAKKLQAKNLRFAIRGEDAPRQF